ncbi:hypothetical protein [Ferrovibrio terrae]|uniref:hypothetical protein n=1 Tax=Ferrovibrio terrae TaxID=2594003 RepID=UPI003137BD86
MALNANNLSAIGYANGFTLWHYTTSDTAATVDTAGYFNGVAGQVRVGDFIMCNTGVGGTPAHGFVVVLSNDGSTVDVGDAVALGGSDTD